MRGDELRFMQDLAHGAGRILKRRFRTAQSWREKSGRGDLVTEVDEESERYIVDRVRARYPEHHILSEEMGAIGSGEGRPVWIIDPLDGTRNYTMGVPFFTVSIGIAMNGRPRMGVIYDPVHDEMFWAKQGDGAYLNGESIRVSDEKSVEDSVVSVSWVKRKVDRRKFVEYIEDLSRDTSYFRRFGSAALVMAYVACGRLHAYLQGGLNPWDVAAGLVLIEEAGGVVTDFGGNQIDLRNKDIEVVTANPELHSTLLDRVIRRTGA